MDFWHRVKEQIRAQDTTQEWVAKKSGQKLRTLQGWISREIMPNADQAQAIASALGVTVEYLVTGTDSTDPWVRNHRKFIEDCKMVTEDQMEVLIALAETQAAQRRRELGKDSASG